MQSMSDLHLKADIVEIAERLGDTTQAFNGKTILICGGGGFLGQYFVDVLLYLNEHMLRTPCKLLALDNLIGREATDSSFEGSPNYTFIKHNIIEPYTYEWPIDFIIQAASMASPYYYRKYPLATLEVAVLGTKNMLDLAKEHGAKFLFFSSSEIYGDPDPKFVPTPETYRGNVSCLGPRACYDESKRAGETLTQIYNKHFGVETNIVRPFNIYGPGMQQTDYRALSNFANQVINGLPLYVYGSGEQTRTFCYVTDAMVGFVKVLVEGLSGEAYNIGNSEPEISILDLVNKIEETLGRKLRFVRTEHPDTYPGDEPLRRCPDITKARTQLKYEPKIDLHQGLRRFLDWAETTYAKER